MRHIVMKTRDRNQLAATLISNPASDPARVTRGGYRIVVPDSRSILISKRIRLTRDSVSVRSLQSYPIGTEIEVRFHLERKGLEFPILGTVTGRRILQSGESEMEIRVVKASTGAQKWLHALWAASTFGNINPSDRTSRPYAIHAA